MTKAIPEGMALITSRTLDGDPRKSSPASEGIPFDWKPYFYGLHSRTQEGADGGTGSRKEYADFNSLFNVRVGGARSQRSSA